MSSLPPDHPDRTTLSAFLEGHLPEEERSAVEVHVAECGECCRVMADFPQDVLSDRLRDVETELGGDSSFVLMKTPDQKETDGIPAALVDHPRYRILELLGRGGMGMVYKAEHRMMDRIVALKVIDARFIDNPQAIERFRNEVKAAARLTHANIVRAYDAEQAGDLHFLVMEFVDGIDLADLIRRNGPLPVDQACGVTRKVAQGLHHAFEQGMVHRDVKPQNIMVTQDGRIRILDFGLARLAREREQPMGVDVNNPQDQMQRTADALTLVGSVLGTPDYIAPEQVSDAHSADTRADIYSLGCTLYCLLTGHPPYPHGSAMDKLVAHSRQTPPPIDKERPDVPPELIAITSKMMARAPADRFQTPIDAARAIETFLKTGATLAVRTERKSVRTNDAAADGKISAYNEPELLRIDLSAISIEAESIALSAVDERQAETLIGVSDTDIESLTPPPPLSQKRASASRRRPTGASARRTKNSATILAVVGAAVLALLAIAFNLPNRDPAEDNNLKPLPAHNSIPQNPSVSEGSEEGTIAARAAKTDWIDLIPRLQDQGMESSAGLWELNGSEVTVNDVNYARMALPYDVPEEYEFEVTFTRNTGVHSVALIFLNNGNQATFDIDAWGKSLAGFQNISLEDCRNTNVNGTGVGDQAITNGERYVVAVRVMSDRTEAWVNGELLTTYYGDGSNLSLIDGWEMNRSDVIGLGAYGSRTTFHRVRVREIRGASMSPSGNPQ